MENVTLHTKPQYRAVARKMARPRYEALARTLSSGESRKEGSPPADDRGDVTPEALVELLGISIEQAKELIAKGLEDGTVQLDDVSEELTESILKNADPNIRKLAW